MSTASTSFIFRLALIAMLSSCAASVFAQRPEQLSLADIITALRSKKATAVEKNQILAEGVRQRGVTFALNADLEKELRNAGADDRLIGSIRAQSPAAQVEPTPQPKVEPQPLPVATPKPPDAGYYQNRANASFVMGDFDAAIKDYSKSIELNPTDPTVYFSRGMAHFNKQSFNPAIEDFSKVIEFDPTESMAYFNRGVALENVGNFDRALADLKKAVEIDAENEPARSALARLESKMPKPVQTVARREPVKPLTPDVDQKPTNEPYFAGPLSEQAVKLAVPAYPQIERQNRIEGVVTVQVTLDEEGKVLAAKATTGPKGLRGASEDAAKRSKFKPVTLGGKPIRATGTVVYNFKLS